MRTRARGLQAGTASARLRRSARARARASHGGRAAAGARPPHTRPRSDTPLARRREWMLLREDELPVLVAHVPFDRALIDEVREDAGGLIHVTIILPREDVLEGGQVQLCICTLSGPSSDHSVDS